MVHTAPYKGLVFLILFLFLGFSALQAEENKFRLGIGLEGNMNTEYGLALGRSLMVDFHYFKYIITGAALTVSDDFSVFTAVEPEILARWYFYNLGFTDGGFFVQGDLGMSFAIEKDGDFSPHFLGGVSGGFRFPFHDGDYYAEPYLKTGYPFIWGFGMRMGCRF
ncbi:MAG: hypothetical protein LBG22_12050 [Treponema sp.]|jgi:hypothetical protein|nr:hypothetical protein [Treponema sp.]